MSEPRILAYTVSYGDRPGLQDLVTNMRGTADQWFDWLVCLGAPSERLYAEAKQALEHPRHHGIQHLQVWEENRGQHHATALALKMARAEKYDWLLRLDDDVRPRTQRWLKRMSSRLQELKDIKGDEWNRFVASPKLVGLTNPLTPAGTINAGQDFPVEVMNILGGACRLHPVELLANYEPDIYDPIGRGDPEGLSNYIHNNTGGFLIRFPDIRMWHHTRTLEAADTPEQAHQRLMSKYWPYLGEEDE